MHDVTYPPNTLWCCPACAAEILSAHARTTSPRHWCRDGPHGWQLVPLVPADSIEARR